MPRCKRSEILPNPDIHSGGRPCLSGYKTSPSDWFTHFGCTSRIEACACGSVWRQMTGAPDDPEENGAQRMKTRVAVFSKTKSSWGGSFQYAKAIMCVRLQ